ncbi:hypothetical protein [Parasediminibacterium sp. JCM 36343]|uniref:hypothetical protein n=1 Tax=Parasediminibacterium sp. JCM 36343 TaxID=3374279 RepID=UPI00397D09BB
MAFFVLVIIFTKKRHERTAKKKRHVLALPQLKKATPKAIKIKLESGTVEAMKLADALAKKMNYQYG